MPIIEHHVHILVETILGIRRNRRQFLWKRLPFEPFQKVVHLRTRPDVGQHGGVDIVLEILDIRRIIPIHLANDSSLCLCLLLLTHFRWHLSQQWIRLS